MEATVKLQVYGWELDFFISLILKTEKLYAYAYSKSKKNKGNGIDMCYYTTPF